MYLLAVMALLYLTFGRDAIKTSVMSIFDRWWLEVLGAMKSVVEQCTMSSSVQSTRLKSKHLNPKNIYPTFLFIIFCLIKVQ
jgi:hypothetical protein